MSSQTVTLKVGMSCEGCVGAVKRVLGKLDGDLFVNDLNIILNLVWFLHIKTSLGVESYDIDLKEQKVVVKGNVEPDTVLKTVSKTGKPTAFWEAEAPSETKAQ